MPSRVIYFNHEFIGQSCNEEIIINDLSTNLAPEVRTYLKLVCILPFLVLPFLAVLHPKICLKQF